MKVEDIDVSLRYGKIFNKNWIILNSISIIVVLLVFGYALYDIILMEYQNRFDLLKYIIIWSICFLSIETWFFYFILKNYKIKKKVKFWLQDAVKLTVFAKEIKRLPAFLFSLEQVAIEVIFKHDGKLIKIKNGNRKQLQVAPYLVKYANKNINILFSPKYNEVMILKNQAIN